MLVNQIAVFLENKQGRLHDVVKSLAANGVNIECLNIADTNEFGIARMVTSDNSAALAVLKKAGFTATSVDLIGVEVANVPGTLSEVLMLLDENNISVEYIYSYTCSEGKTLILLKASDAAKAQIILQKHNI